MVRRNIVSNLAGKVWSAGISIALIPVYVRVLGVESYGLVGFGAALTSLLGLLDLGLSTTASRTMATLSAAGTPNGSSEIRDYAKSYERFFVALGIIAAVPCIFLAPYLSRHWLSSTQVSPRTVSRCIELLAATFAVSFPGDGYSNLLIGLQKQVAVNLITVGVMTARQLTTLLVVFFFSRTIEAFFACQLFFAAAQTWGAGIVLYQYLPPGPPGKFRRSLLMHEWRFSLGLLAISLVAVLLTQADKIVLSKVLTLGEFGYYSVASTVGNALYLVIGPVFIAVFPRLCQLVRSGSTLELSSAYHRACQLMSAMIFPAAIVVVVSANEMLWVWTGSRATADHLSHIAIFLTVGTALNGLVNIPYGLQLAYGWTRLTLLSNIVAVLVFVPLLYYLGTRYGASGAALCWPLLNLSYVVILIQLQHRRLLRGEQWAWYFKDVLLPGLGAGLAIVPLRLIAPLGHSRLASAVMLFAFLVAGTVGSFVATVGLRAELHRIMPRLLKSRGAI